MKNCDLTTTNGNLSVKNGDLIITNGGLVIKIGIWPKIIGFLNGNIIWLKWGSVDIMAMV